jgi:GMP synthase (glutamine-hydrolysing)
LQHVPFEGLGSIEGWAEDRGHTVHVTRLWAGDPLPSPGAFDWLIVMGGPMSVHDEGAHPWLAREKRFLRASLDAGTRVLGICLGAQLLAEALGARVRPARAREIGWFPVTLTPEARGLGALAGLPERWEVFHWHGEAFDLPRGGARLASSDACENQAFAYGSYALAFQFHPEATRRSVEELIRHSGHEITDGPYMEPPAAMLGDEPRFVKARERMRGILDALAPAGAPAAERPS